METSLVDRIAGTWFGAEMSRGCIARLAEMARVYEAPAKTTLLQEGHETLELSVLVTGRVAISEHVPGRGSVKLMTVEAGDIFGWSALMPPYHATLTVTATERVEVIGIDGARLREMVKSDPMLAACVYRRTFDAVGRRLYAVIEQLLDVYQTGT